MIRKAFLFEVVLLNNAVILIIILMIGAHTSTTTTTTGFMITTHTNPTINVVSTATKQQQQRRSNGFVRYESSSSSSSTFVVRQTIVRKSSSSFSYMGATTANTNEYDNDTNNNDNESINETETNNYYDSYVSTIQSATNSVPIPTYPSSLSTSSTSTGSIEKNWSVTDNWERLSEAIQGRDYIQDTQQLMNQNIIDSVSSILRSQKSTLRTRTNDNEDDEWMDRTIDSIYTDGSTTTTTTTVMADYNDDDKDITTGGTYDIISVADDVSVTDEAASALAFDEEMMSTEIAMLVRCNERPDQMLIDLGRSVPELTVEQLNDVAQLVQYEETQDSTDAISGGPKWVATIFLHEAVRTMFEQHATTFTKINGSVETYKVFDAKAIASWMQTSLRPNPTLQQQKQSVYSKYYDTTEYSLIGPHDRRIIETIAKYGTYGCNFLTEDQLVQLYVATIVGNNNDKKSNSRDIDSFEILQNVRRSEIMNVWRDIRNHNIISPVELQYKMDLAQLYDDIGVSPPPLQPASVTTLGSSSTTTGSTTLLDECELIYEDDVETNHHQTSRTSDKQGRSSHELVQVITNTSNDNNNNNNNHVSTPIPLYIQDGTFVFIDEETCIGCMQCVTTAPSSFKIVTDTGRARTYQQRSNVPDVEAAVQSCPITDCMHYVSYDELMELEYIRDNGFGGGPTTTSSSDSSTNDRQSTNDHRHFGHSETRGYIPRVPLHVSRRDSDANHKSSFYHFIKNKCFKSSNCPQRGCYSCPRYQSDPDANPYFQEKVRQANHLRAQYFTESGIADSYRTTTEL